MWAVMPQIVCFYMVKLFKFNGHTPLLELEVAILKYISGWVRFAV